MKAVEIEDRRWWRFPATAGRQEIVDTFKKYDRVALPVVDGDGQMVGIITAGRRGGRGRAQATEEIRRWAAWRRWTRRTWRWGSGRW